MMKKNLLLIKDIYDEYFSSLKKLIKKINIKKYIYDEKFLSLLFAKILVMKIFIVKNYFCNENNLSLLI